MYEYINVSCTKRYSIYNKIYTKPFSRILVLDRDRTLS